MGKLNIFVISFNNLQGVYYAGQTVDGHVTVELTDTMKMRGIHIKLNGKAYVHWTERHTTGSGKNRRTTTRHYSATEHYFDYGVLLAGRWKRQSGEDIELHAGRHVFPFSFQLPPQLPSSFEGAHGHVRYVATGTIDKPWKFDHTTKRAFTIISVMDLNREPAALLPSQASNMKEFCCLCCASGPVSATFRLDRQGYVPGEAILIKAEIDNKSNRKMNYSSVNLTMTTAFHATTKSRRSYQRVAELRHGQILQGDSDYWNGDQLVVPPLPPSFLAGCRIIDIAYTLELRVDPAGIGFDLVVPLGVVIGTIPLQQVLAQNPPVASHEVQPIVAGALAPYPPGEQTPSAPVYPPEMSNVSNLPPPSYAECVFGKVDVKEEEDSQHTRGETNFAPIYTYYDWGHTPSAPPPQ